jgi:hypothetical protein
VPTSRGSSGPAGVTAAQSDSGQRTFFEFIGSLPRYDIGGAAQAGLQAENRSV